MPIIKWTQEFSVGDSELDDQHKKWMEIYNKAHDRMMDPEEENFQSTGLDALKEMDDYSQHHFAREESYMKELGYPELDTHKFIHNQFSKEIRQQIQDLESGNHILNSEVIKRIENWLVHHILKEDQKFRIHAEKMA